MSSLLSLLVTSSRLLKISSRATTRENTKTPDVARFAVSRVTSRALSQLLPSNASEDLSLIEIEGGSDLDENA